MELGEQAKMQYGGFSKVYDHLMLEDVDYDRWSEYVHDLLGRYGTDISHVVDCACGTGLLSIRLAKYGYQVTGLDISEDMLMQAAINARNAGQRIQFVRMDMRSIALHRPADAIISTCDGVNYLTDISELNSFFSKAYNIIRPNGLILFDISTRYKLEHVLGDNTFADDGDDVAYIWKNTYDPETKLSQMELSLFIKQSNVYERVYEYHVQRAHSINEIKSALDRAGFTEIHVYNAFSFNEPNHDTERIQFVARR